VIAGGKSEIIILAYCNTGEEINNLPELVLA
jgi:hypothetical protein